MKLRRQYAPEYDRDSCIRQLFLSEIREECGLRKKRVWEVVAAILVKVYKKLTIQARSKVPEKEVSPKGNVALENREHPASYGSLAQCAGLENHGKLVVQRGPAMQD